MGLKLILTRGKLQKMEREAKRLHGLQKRARDQLHELAEQHKKGAVDKAKYEEKKAKIEAHKHELTEKMKHVEEQERALRAEVKALEAAA